MTTMLPILLWSIVVLCIVNSSYGLFQLGGGRAKLISNILQLADVTQRGLIETPEQNLAMRKLFEGTATATTTSTTSTTTTSTTTTTAAATTSTHYCCYYYYYLILI